MRTAQQIPIGMMTRCLPRGSLIFNPGRRVDQNRCGSVWVGRGRAVARRCFAFRLFEKASYGF